MHVSLRFRCASEQVAREFCLAPSHSLLRQLHQNSLLGHAAVPRHLRAPRRPRMVSIARVVACAVPPRLLPSYLQQETTFGGNSADIDSTIASKIASRACFAKDPKWFVLTALRWHGLHKGDTHSDHRGLRRLSSGSCSLREVETLPIRMASTQPHPSSRFPDPRFSKLQARKARTAGGTIQRKTLGARPQAQFGDKSACNLAV